MFTIKTKIVVAYTLAFGILIAGFAATIYESMYDAELAKLDARLESHADKLQTELEEDHLEPGFPKRSELDSIHTEGLSSVKVRLLTLNKTVVFADSGFDLETRMRWNSGPENLPKKESVKLGRRRYRVMQWPVDIENHVQYVVQVAAPMHEVEDVLEHLSLLFFIVIPAGLLLAGGAAYFITALAFRPMMNMVKTAGTISATNLDGRLELPKAHDEVHMLGKAFNEMIARIEGAIKSQRQFVADASHELRTPLTIMRSELEFAERSMKKSHLKASIGSALSELDHLALMVNDLLTLARLDSSQMKLELAPIRLDELLVECVQSVRGIAKEHGVKLKVFIEEAVEISGDYQKLMSVIFNLLDNAIKYSPKKGAISASLVLNQVIPRTASIVIKDHGVGISKAERGKIFSRFYRGMQSRSRTEGSGLGLAIAQRFVELHSGTISVQSEEGRGSTFIVELPIVQSTLSSQ